MKVILPPHARLYAVGGANPGSMKEWLAAGAVGFGLGSDRSSRLTDDAGIAKRAKAAVASTRRVKPHPPCHSPRMRATRLTQHRCKIALDGPRKVGHDNSRDQIAIGALIEGETLIILEGEILVFETRICPSAGLSRDGQRQRW